MSDPFADLEIWYTSQCDEDWEHQFGVSIGTLDNPGWSVIVDLTGTLLEEKPFPLVEIKESEESWLQCFVRDHQFHAAGDPARLRQMVSVFIEWAKTAPDWLSLPPSPPESNSERTSDQAFWNEVDSTQEESCKHEGCTRKRIKYSGLCRTHHFQQIRKRPPPSKTVAEIWAVGPGRAELRTKLLAELTQAFGTGSIKSTSDPSQIILTIEWLAEKVELLLIEVPQESTLKLQPSDESYSRLPDCIQDFIRFFCSSVVRPAAATTGGVAILLNLHMPED